MRQYIGTKIIRAESATRGECYKGPDVLNSEKANELGYRIKYPDGYESWSPKNVFEEAYRPTNKMNFGFALEALKKGKRVARNGWNGKNQYIELASNISYASPAGKVVNCEHDAIGNKAIAFIGTSGVQMGWLASQADMLAEDWHIVD